ncbi:MAG: hypothetical protein WBX20_01040 [Terrimicrobiaceae bacterium]
MNARSPNNPETTTESFHRKVAVDLNVRRAYLKAKIDETYEREAQLNSRLQAVKNLRDSLQKQLDECK